MQGLERTSAMQATYQLIGIVSTVAIAIVGGALTGMILNIRAMRQLKKDQHHDDDIYWNVPEDFKHIWLLFFRVNA